MNTLNSIGRYITLNQASQELGLTYHQTIYRLKKAGIECSKMGTATILKTSDMNKLKKEMNKN